MSKLAEKFILPEDRMPRAFNQDIVDKNGKIITYVGSCPAAAIVKTLEVIYYIKTGIRTKLSVGFVYGRHNYPGSKKPGMNEAYVLNKMLTHGTVPENMCSDYDEKPEIIEKIESRPDIDILDKESEKWVVPWFENISGNNTTQKFENIKKYLVLYHIPLVGTIKKYKGSKHCVNIVGYEDDYILFHNHTGSDELERVKYDEFGQIFLLGGIEEVGILKNDIDDMPEEKSTGNTEANEKGEDNMAYKLIDVQDFKKYLDSLTITRKIENIQLHHTSSPSYAQFEGNNHIALQNGMRDYHIKTRGFNDIAQTFTIFPDGKICTGRNINKAPAGIYGANSAGICIECLGNFDKGGDKMTESQKNTIVGVVKILLDKFGLDAKTGVTYHSWWTSGGTSLGTYVSSKSVKTCPGTNFFGGNTKQAYEKTLMLLVEKWGQAEKKMLETANDITWELNHTYFPIDDVEGFKNTLEEAKQNNSPLYWGYYKLVNRVK